jgi:N-acetylmuramoyl-L-alanine amidase
MGYVCAIGAGHGGFGVTPGKRSPAGEYEWNFNSKIVESAIVYLKASGISVIRLDDPTGKTDVSLAARKAKGDSADIYVSIHNNANAGQWWDGGGTETFYYEGSASSKKLATLIHNEAVGVLKRPNRGIKKGNHLYEVSKTKPPAVLLEGLFFDSRQDIVLLRNNNVLAELGKAVARGICAYFGIAFKELKPQTPPKPQPTSPTPSKGIHRVIVNGKQVGAFGDDRNVLEAVEKALKENASKIEIQKI